MMMLLMVSFKDRTNVGMFQHHNDMRNCRKILEITAIKKLIGSIENVTNCDDLNQTLLHKPIRILMM